MPLGTSFTYLKVQTRVTETTRPRSAHPKCHELDQPEIGRCDKNSYGQNLCFTCSQVFILSYSLFVIPTFISLFIS